MRTTASLSEFLADRIGACLRTRHFSYAMPSEDLSIGLAVGRFDRDDLRAVVPLLEAVRDFSPHAAIWDFTRIEDVVPEAFVDLERFFVGRFRDRIAVQKVAIIAPASGPLRAVAAGMFALLDPPYPAAAFATLDQATAWIGVTGDFSALVETEAAALTEGDFAVVVGAWLDAHLTSAAIDACAHDLGVSVRTLQRRLATHATSFVEELNGARVRAAALRLSKTNASLTEIAYEIGFSSPQRFASVFRKLRGESPSDARARLRLALRDT